MPVVINEFEVVPEPASSTPPAPADTAVPAQRQPPDIEMVLATLRARRDRVRVY